MTGLRIFIQRLRGLFFKRRPHCRKHTLDCLCLRLPAYTNDWFDVNLSELILKDSHQIDHILIRG
jgi:hypothetical protein